MKARAVSKWQFFLSGISAFNKEKNKCRSTMPTMNKKKVTCSENYLSFTDLKYLWIFKNCQYLR